MCANYYMGLYIDYEYIHKTLERTYQVNPDPRQIVDTINGIVAGCAEELVLKKAYALWNDFTEAKQAFEENAYETIDTTCGLNCNNELMANGKSNTVANSTELTICCDVMESLASHQMTHYYLAVGDGKFEELVNRLHKKGLVVKILGFNGNIPPNLKQCADSYITLDDLVKRFHKEDIINIVETFISLSRKLPYVGYKYLMDILSRNDLHTDYRQLLNQAQDEGVIKLVEVEDPNTVRGKAFAIKLVTEHPIIAKHLQEMGLAADTLAQSASLQIRDHAVQELDDSHSAEDHSDSRFTAGKRLVEIGQHEAAISEFFNYLEDYPNDFLGFVYVINCLIKTGDRKQARVWCKKALNLPNCANNQKEYPRWFTYMKRISSREMESITDEEERIELSG